MDRVATTLPRCHHYTGIILAAGRNTRLQGVIPSYHKPLVVVNGRPLIVSLVKDLQSWCEHVIVVVSPENCAVIGELLQYNNLLSYYDVSLVVQPTSRGPGEALLRGLQLARQERILLALGDNVIPAADLVNVVAVDRQEDDAKTVTVATTLIIDDRDAEKFTRVLKDEFIENRPGGYVDGEGGYHCWVGPMLFDRAEATKLFTRAALAPGLSAGEIKVSQIFNGLAGLKINQVMGNSVDVGTPDALLQVS